MLTKIINFKKKLSKQLSTPTVFCRVCFQEIKLDSFLLLVDKNPVICAKCQKLFNPKFHYFTLDGVSGIAIYDYDEVIQKHLFQLKGNGDYALAPIFLHHLKTSLKFEYSNYILLPAPSHESHDERRGFNHVQAIFSIISLPIVDAFKKTVDIKQTSLNQKERAEVKKHIVFECSEKLQNKNVLLIDDVKTTGSTLKRMIELVLKENPKKIKILVLSQTHDLSKK